ncbi:hypothetical protein KKA47_04245 [bacterium]|nr:hypothetical protein [bacterium]
MYFGGLKVDTDPVDAVRLVSLVGDATSNEFQSLIKKQFVNGNDGAERLLAEI